MIFYAILLMQIFIGQSGSSKKPAEKLPLAEKLFPEAELIWSKTFEGKMIDFAIAEKSGHIAIGAVKENWKGRVYLFTQDGKLLWTKENGKDSEIKKSAGIKVSVSDSCETIGIFWWGDFEREEVQVYDITGEKLYSCEHGMSGVGVEISPGGGYVKHAWFFDKTGKRIVLRDILKGLPIEKLRRRIEYKNGTYSPYIYRGIKFAFVSEKEIAVLLDKELYFYSFPEGELKWKSEELEGGGKITVQGRYILRSGDQKVYLFNKDGRLIWEAKKFAKKCVRSYEGDDRKILVFNRKTGKSEEVKYVGTRTVVPVPKTEEEKERDKKLDSQPVNLGEAREPERKLYYHTVSFSTDMKYLAIHAWGRILLFDSKTGEIKLCTSRLESDIGTVNLLCLGDKVLLSGYTGSYVKDIYKGYWTYILHFDKEWNIIDESWEKGLVFGTSTSPLIGIYESNATGKTESGYDEGVLGYENATVFTINILKIRD